MENVAWIQRAEIEDGFLDGLDLEFSPGLNVIIGARGTGKTSLLELIRFALGSPAFTDQAAALGAAQVRAVLGRGRVTITIEDDDGQRYSVSRTVGTPATATVSATVLAQNEIEAVGASASGRLHLVDRFLPDDYAIDLAGLEAGIAAIGKQVDTMHAEIASLRDRVAELPGLEQAILGLQASQEEAFERASASEADRARLAELQSDLQEASLRQQLLGQTEQAIEALRRRLTGASEIASMPSWPLEAGPDPAIAARDAFARAVDLVAGAESVLAEAVAVLSGASTAETAVRARAEDEARELRRRLGAVDAEVSSLSNQIAELNERIGSLRALDELATDRTVHLQTAVAKRDALCLELDDLRERRFQGRAQVVERLNRDLEPTIKVEIVQSAEMDDYRNEIIARLRGSGLHSKTLAPELVANLSPLELVRLIEVDGAAEVAAMTGLALARVQAALARLRNSSPSGLAAASIDDAVDLFLLDGATLKPSGELSIGQRCTAVLPLLLQRHGDVLVIDQPEDHLDNAFVTSTLVGSLRSRPAGDQVILASHNANVPVLGEADRVIHMDSDGRRGFIVHAGALDDPQTVKAVSDVMEGGAEAFRRRAEFYERHGDDAAF